MVYALLAAIPFLTALILMVGFKFSSGKSLIISLIVTIVLALGVWKMDAHTVLAYFLYGALKSLDLLLIISGAILLLNTLKQTGISGGVEIWEGTGDICVVYPKDYRGPQMRFTSTGGTVQIQTLK